MNVGIDHYMIPKREASSRRLDMVATGDGEPMAKPARFE